MKKSIYFISLATIPCVFSTTLLTACGNLKVNFIRLYSVDEEPNFSFNSETNEIHVDHNNLSTYEPNNFLFFKISQTISSNITIKINQNNAFTVNENISWLTFASNDDLTEYNGKTNDVEKIDWIKTKISENMLFCDPANKDGSLINQTDPDIIDFWYKYIRVSFEMWNDSATLGSYPLNLVLFNFVCSYNEEHIWTAKYVNYKIISNFTYVVD